MGLLWSDQEWTLPVWKSWRALEEMVRLLEQQEHGSVWQEREEQ